MKLLQRGLLVLTVLSTCGLLWKLPSTRADATVANETIYTNSTLTVVLNQDTVNDVNVREYDTTVLGIVAAPGGNQTVFNTTVSGPPALQETRTALGQAYAAVANVSGAGNVAPPSLVNASIATSSNTSINVTATNSVTVNNITTYTGPLNILIGPNQDTPLMLAGGQTDIDVLETTTNTVYRNVTVTNATHKSSIYVVVGQGAK